MIGTINIKCNAAHPEMALTALYAYANSPSSLRVLEVPKKIGKWLINAVRFSATYPDGTVETANCVLTSGVWVGTIAGNATVGSTQNGYAIYADGLDENGDAVTGYVLGKGDLIVLDADGEQKPEERAYYVKLLEEERETPRNGDMWPDDGQYFIYQDGEANPIGVSEAELSVKADLSALDLKADISALDTKADLSALASKADISAIPTNVSQLSNDSGYLTSADVQPAPRGVYQGFAKNSMGTLAIYRRNAYTNSIDYNTYLTLQSNVSSAVPVLVDTTYASWSLSAYNGTAFSTPIELEWNGYVLTYYAIIGGRPRAVGVNSYIWKGSDTTGDYIVKGELDTDGYIVPTDFGTRLGTARTITWHTATYNEAKTSILTIDGQADSISCSRPSTQPVVLNFEYLAYQSEVSSKADLSALDNYLPLSGGNIPDGLNLSGGDIKVTDYTGYTSQFDIARRTGGDASFIQYYGEEPESSSDLYTNIAIPVGRSGTFALKEDLNRKFVTVTPTLMSAGQYYCEINSTNTTFVDCTDLPSSPFSIRLLITRLKDIEEDFNVIIYNPNGANVSFDFGNFQWHSILSENGSSLNPGTQEYSLLELRSLWYDSHSSTPKYFGKLTPMSYAY